MNTQFFRYALEVARCKSISQAADRLFLSQPSLSKAIKEMEENLGFAVFRRSTRGVALTPLGKKFLESARRIVAELDQVERIPLAEDAVSLRFSIPRSSYLATAVAEYLSRLSARGTWDVVVQETNSMQAIENVSQGRGNLGVIRTQPAYEAYFMDCLKEYGLQSEPIWEADFAVVFSAGHPLAKAPALSLETLQRGVEIVYGDMYVPYLSSDESVQRRDHQMAPRHIMLFDRANQFELLTRLPSAYLWASPIPAALLERYGLAQRPCPQAGRRFKDRLIYPRGYALNAADRKLVDSITAVRDSLSIR